MRQGKATGAWPSGRATGVASPGGRCTRSQTLHALSNSYRSHMVDAAVVCKQEQGAETANTKWMNLDSALPSTHLVDAAVVLKQELARRLHERVLGGHQEEVVVQHLGGSSGQNHKLACIGIKACRHHEGSRCPARASQQMLGWMACCGKCSKQLPCPAHGVQGKASASRPKAKQHEHGAGGACRLCTDAMHQESIPTAAHLLALGQLRLRAVEIVLHKQAAHKLGDGVTAQWCVQSAAGQPSGCMPPLRPLPTAQPLPSGATPFHCSATRPHLYS